MSRYSASLYCSFFNDTATTEIYTLSLHDALPILKAREAGGFSIKATGRGPEICGALERNLLLDVYCEVLTANGRAVTPLALEVENGIPLGIDRKSTRLNSSHPSISYAVFCLKKKR